MRIAVLGLGAMGSRMAARLIATGHEVTVWNRSAGKAAPLVELGATLAATPREAAAEAGAVITMLRDDQVSATVWTDPGTGILAGIRPGALAIESSTITPGHARTLARAAAAAGASFVEAPVSGSRPQAEQGTLVYFLGCAGEVLEEALAVLQPLGQAWNHLGEPGTAAVVKLATNTMMGLQVAAWAELIPMLERSGVDADAALKAMSTTSVWSPASGYFTASMRNGAFQPAFPVELIAKDIAYALEEGGAAQMPMTTRLKALFDTAIAEGHGAQNMTALVELNRA